MHVKEPRENTHTVRITCWGWNEHNSSIVNELDRSHNGLSSLFVRIDELNLCVGQLLVVVDCDCWVRCLVQ